MFNWLTLQPYWEYFLIGIYSGIINQFCQFTIAFCSFDLLHRLYHFFVAYSEMFLTDQVSWTWIHCLLEWWSNNVNSTGVARQTWPSSYFMWRVWNAAEQKRLSDKWKVVSVFQNSFRLFLPDKWHIGTMLSWSSFKN